MRRRVTYLSLTAAVLVALLAACGGSGQGGFYVELASQGDQSFDTSATVPVGAVVQVTAFTVAAGVPDCDVYPCNPNSSYDETWNSTWTSSDPDAVEFMPPPALGDEKTVEAIEPGVTKICADLDDATGHHHDCATLTITAS